MTPTRVRPRVTATHLDVELFGKLIIACGVLATLTSGPIGCSAPDSMPTLPTTPQDRTWSRVYPATTAQPLRAVWGTDADAMWAVGDLGTIVHHDGHGVLPVPSPTAQHLTAIVGRSRDSIWAASRTGEVLYWDGRRWALSSTVVEAQLSCLELIDGQLFAGGLAELANGWRAGIWRFDGAGWRPMGIPADATGPVTRIWKTSDGTLLAICGNELLIHDQGLWQVSNRSTKVVAVAGSLALLRRDDGSLLLGRERHGDYYDVQCWQPLPAFRYLVDCRAPIAAGHHAIHRFDGCAHGVVHTTEFEITNLAVPSAGGSQGSHIFITGHDGGLTRLTWRDDTTIEASLLTPQPTSRLLDQLAGHDTLLATVDWQGRLLVHEADTWRVVATPWPIAQVAVTTGGNLLLRGHEQQLGLGDGRGDWQVLAACPATIREVWVRADGCARAMAFDLSERSWQLWGLDGGVWSLLATLPESYGAIEAFVGFAPDDLYALFTKSGVYWLLHHDGAQWQEALPDADLSVRRIAAGPWSGSLYLEAVRANNLIGGYIADGDFVQFPGAALSWHELVETAAGDVFVRRGSTIFERAPDRWTSLPDEQYGTLRRLWAQADLGLFVITETEEILHRNLPERAR